MKVLLIGSSGALGNPLKESLQSLFPAWKIYGLSRAKGDDVECDLTNYSSIQNTLRSLKPDIILYTAAFWAGLDDKEESFNLNLHPILNVLHLMSDVKKFIFISSDAVITKGDTSRLTPVNYPHNTYGAAKFISEELVKSICEIKKVNFTIIRPSHFVSSYEVFSPGKSHVITNLTHKIFAMKKLVGFDELSNTETMSFTCVYDLIECITSSLTNNLIINKTIYVSNPQKVNLNYVLALIYKYSNKDEHNENDLNIEFFLNKYKPIHKSKEKFSNLFTPINGYKPIENIVQSFIKDKYQ